MLAVFTYPPLLAGTFILVKGDELAGSSVLAGIFPADIGHYRRTPIASEPQSTTA